MEIPNLGYNCVETHCNQLDFLPMTCKCGKVFCSKHFANHSLNCHLDEIQNKPIIDKDTKAEYACSKESCNQRSYVPLICVECNKHYCVQHRHVTGCSEEDPRVKAVELEKFNAASKQFNEVQSVINKKLDAAIIEAQKKPKTSKMANKVQLMRIKSKATGLKAIPTADRVYFNIQKPAQSQQTVPTFVSKMWTVGKAIDAIADECNVPNRNNQSGAPKLRLFHKNTGKSISSNLSSTINSLLLEEALLDGEDLILEYVDTDCLLLSVS